LNIHIHIGKFKKKHYYLKFRDEGVIK